MSKQENKVENKVNNPFEQLETTTTSPKARTIAVTPQLNGIAQTRAVEFIKLGSTFPERANKVVAGDTAELHALLVENFESQIDADSQILKGLDDDVLDRLLESRRSDRSKARSKTNQMDGLLKFVSAMYAELMIRNITGKPFSGSSSDVLDEADNDAVSRKIKSLQSKACRLRKTAPFVPDDQVELDLVQNEIDRLNSIRGVTTTKLKEKIDIGAIKQALESLPDDQMTEQMKELLAKIS